jgi:hypothetical protein
VFTGRYELQYSRTPSGLIGTARFPDMRKIRIIGSFVENRLHWQFEVRLLLFIVCTGYKTFDHVWFEVLKAIKLIRQPVISRQVSFVFSTNLPERAKPIRITRGLVSGVLLYFGFPSMYHSISAQCSCESTRSSYLNKRAYPGNIRKAILFRKSGSTG